MLFRSALQDALMHLEDKSAVNILAGGIDEMTLNHLSIVRRLGDWKMQPESNMELLAYKTEGAMAGEGSGFFLLSSEKNKKSYATISNVVTLYKPGPVEKVEEQIRKYLGTMDLVPDDIDLFLTGINGDNKSDEIYYTLAKSLFKEKPLAWFKHLCGEYHTASAFALWVSANSIKHQYLPPSLLVSVTAPEKIKKILVYNQMKGVNHALMLVSAI